MGVFTAIAFDADNAIIYERMVSGVLVHASLVWEFDFKRNKNTYLDLGYQFAYQDGGILSSELKREAARLKENSKD